MSIAHSTWAFGEKDYAVVQLAHSARTWYKFSDICACLFRELKATTIAKEA